MLSSATITEGLGKCTQYMALNCFVLRCPKRGFMVLALLQLKYYHNETAA